MDAPLLEGALVLNVSKSKRKSQTATMKYTWNNKFITFNNALQINNYNYHTFEL